MNISTKLKLGNILFGCLRQVGCLKEVTINSGLTVSKYLACCSCAVFCIRAWSMAMISRLAASSSCKSATSFGWPGPTAWPSPWPGDGAWVTDENRSTNGRTKLFSKYQIPPKYLFTLVAYNLKSAKSSVHEHVYCRQTMTFHAHEIKWFQSVSISVTVVSCWIKDPRKKKSQVVE